MSETSGLSRREVLKLMGLGGGSLILAACGIPVGRNESEKQTLRTEEGSFVEIPNGSAIVLTDTNGNEAVISMSYAGDVVPIQMRGDRYQIDEELNAFRYDPKPFSPGQEVKRYTGEILETKMYQLTTNPDLPEDREIEVRHAPYRGLRLSGISKGDTVTGIPVLTGFENKDWPTEGAGWELNPTRPSDMNSYEKWAKGWLVGEVSASQSENGEGIYAFRARGYVHRNELLVPMSETSEG